MPVLRARTTSDRRPSPDGRRPRSWTPPLADGAYSRHPAWTDRVRWLAQVAAVVRTSYGEGERSAAHVAVDTLLMVAAADAAVADQRTGRNVATAHETVAAELGMSSKTVQRARTLLERLGMAVTVWAGRYLTVEERSAARRRHGALQLRAASTRALVSPRRATALVPVENVQLPRRGQPTPNRHPSRSSSTRIRAKQKSASTPPIPIGVQKLAAQLVRRMPWLARGKHIGALARLLQQHQLSSEAGWSAERLLTVLEQHTRMTAGSVPDPARQRNPLGYLHWLLTAASERLRTATPEPARAVTVRAEPAWMQEAAERTMMLAEEDPAVCVAVIAQIRADIAADHRQVRRGPKPARVQVGRRLGQGR